MKPARTVALALLVAAVPSLARAQKADGRVALLEAMKTELERSRTGLQLQGHEPPYFIAYQLKDQENASITSRYGSIFEDRIKRDAKLFVDVRVGTYDKDSSEASDEMAFLMGGGEDGPTYQPDDDGPLEPDPGALRNALWLITDSKYKAALSSWLKKRGKAVYAPDDDDKAPSFTREQPVKTVEPPVPFPFSRDAWRRRASELSAMFRRWPEIFDSQVHVTGDKVVRIQTTSEGTELVTEDTIYAVHVDAMTRAPDGQLLDNSRDFYARSEAALPDQEKMKSEVEQMVKDLLALRHAPVIDPYTGPALLAPEATGVLFHETVGHRLEGDRQDDDSEGRTFKGQVGKRVLPAFLTIVDDPTAKAAGKEELNGYYPYDDEGVPGLKTVLIEKGVMRSFILSRKPVKGFDRSNGHGRSQSNRSPAARMANLFVLSDRRVPDAKLREMLIDEAKRAKKPYALLIKDITGGNTNTSSYGYQAFKGVPRLVYRIDVKTGKEELVRGVEIVGTPLTSINKIVATGDHLGVFNGYCGAESGYVPVSTVARRR
jgi:TldD protein